ncbi:hypothetical protein ST37_06150 [Vibrio sp. qd031]|uniref:hypothetical protein n=1 Tax=Vibrio sp. qd031 TaxID=1603038 RepID=UPI000A0F4455|nr:hypothetical protein [Vibrio sp. qd031]ORT50975.1 hypothetical protein ST37_06150 [Vibrio sp. qd031]
MAQTFNFDALVVSSAKEKKAYSLSFKGLMMHLMDILFVDNSSKNSAFADDLSSHMQKDVGLMR